VDWQTVAILIIILWAIAHSFIDFQQTKRLDKLEEQMKK